MKNLKHLAVKFDAKAVGDDGSFSGYASTFGNVDRGGDVVMPGAFAKSLAMRPANCVKMLWQHDPSQPIGKYDEAYEDDKGLFVRGHLLTTDIPKAKEVYALMKADVIDSMSIGYQTLEASYAKDGSRQLMELGLWEVSLVTFPMNPEATVQTVKEFDPRELEASLRRDAGLSRSEAVKAVAVFRKLQRDAGANVESDPREADTATIPASIADSLRRLQAVLR